MYVHQRRTLGWDDLIIFKYFRVYFSLKNKIIQFPLSFNLYFRQKRAPKLSICHLPTKRFVWVFDVTDCTNGFSILQSYHQVVMYPGTAPLEGLFCWVIIFLFSAKKCLYANKRNKDKPLSRKRVYSKHKSIQSLKMPKFLKLRMPKCVLKIEIIHYK